MKFERLLKLIGITLFLIVASLTYYTMTPVTDATNTTLGIANVIAGTTASTAGDNSIITNIYRTTTAIVSGGVISLLSMFIIKLMRTDSLKKQTETRYYKSHSR